MKAIYFDTNVFYHIGFDVDHEEFYDVLCLAQSLDIERWATPITIGEIISGIHRKFTAVKDSYKQISKIIHRVTDDDNANYLDIEQLQNAEHEAISDIYDFFNEKFTIIPYESLDEGDISTVFDNYFSSIKPFGNGNKKSEFPDAFQLELIKRNIRRKESVMLVTSDGDFKNCGSNFNVQKSLSKAKDELLKLWKDKNLALYEALMLQIISSDMPVEKLVSDALTDNILLTQCMVDEVLYSLREKKLIELHINGKEYRGRVKARFIEAIIIKNNAETFPIH